MSKTTERALEDVQKSEFIFQDTNQIEVRNAVMFWTNFRGEANKFGNAARTFNLAINDDVAKILSENGWRVRQYDHEDGSILYFVNIKVNMDSAYPPMITLFTTFRGKRSRRPLGLDNVADLDRIDIESCDCTINAYTSKMFPGKVTGYLKKLNVIQVEDIEFGGKYDDWLDQEEESMMNEELESNPFTDQNENPFGK